MRFHVVAMTMLLAASAGPAIAQQMYKCGNTFSQTPCAPDAVVKRVPGMSAADAPSGVSGYELCAAAAPRLTGTPEPESARVRADGDRKSEVIQYAGQSVAAVRYDLSVDAKTEYGVYSGLRNYSCWLSEDLRRVLQFSSRPKR